MRSPLIAARLAAVLLALACGLPILAGQRAAAPAPATPSGYFVGTIGKSLHVQMDLAAETAAGLAQAVKVVA